MKVRYKCCILPHGKEIESIDFAMGSRQDNHGIDTLTSQIKWNSLLYFIYHSILRYR